MKRNLLLKTMLLLCAIVVGTSSSWATDVTINFGTGGNGKWAANNDATFTDSDSRTWTRVCSVSNMSGQAGYSQFGNTSNTPTVTLTAAAGSDMTVTAFSVTMNGGSGDSQGTIYLIKKSGSTETELATASVTSSSNVTCSITTSQVFSSTDELEVKYVGKQKSIRVTKLTYSYTSGGGGSDPSIVIGTPVNIGADEKDDVIEVTYNNFTPASSNVQFYESDGTTPATYDWISANINAANNIAYHVAANTSSATRSAYLKVQSEDSESNEVTSNLVAITQSVPPINYNLATSIVPGRHYIITNGTTGSIKAMGSQNSNNRAAVEVTATTGTVSISSDAGVHEVLIAIDEETGYFTIFDEATGTSGGYLYAACGTGTGNHMRTYNKLDDYGRWTISIANDGKATILAQDGGRNNMRYNSGNSLFSCYASGNQSDIYLFERDGDTGTQEATLSINAACKDGEATPTYYGTYSAPFAFVVPADLTVSAVGISDGKLVVTNYITGNIVKANTGVMISSTTAGEHNVVLSGAEGTEFSSNMLKATGTGDGISATDMAEAAPNCTYYRLTMHNASTTPPGKIGFWWGAAEGGIFAVAANKAYLAVPIGVSSAKEGFTFEDTTTGINGVEEIAPVTKTRKVVKNGRLVIETPNGEFTIDGARVK